MSSGFRWKLGAVVLAFLLGAWFLKDTIRNAMLTPTERAAMTPDEAAKLRAKSIPLGLDLQGGMHLVLEVDQLEALRPKEAGDAVDRAIEVIRNRIDQFGVAEPNIQQQGEDRIVVQLPGIQDIERAKDLIGQTALLEFKIVQSAASVQEVLGKVDEAVYLRNKAASGDTAAAATDTLLAGMEAEEEDRRPLSRYIGFLGQSDQDNPLVKEPDVSAVKAMLDDPAVQRLLPGGVQFSWGRESRKIGEETYRDLYLLKKTAELTGSAIQNAIVQIGLDQDNPAAPGVELTMNSRGRNVFARITGENVGRRMAIVLDGEVHTAPNIRERIPRGVASITGGFDDAEAKILAIVLRAGALPAPIEILEERSVGPSLGKDSIDSGIKASLIAMAAVFGFMVFYYRISGFFAVIALILNLVLVVAAMVWIDATLTLPGIAGLILTLGMAVDANVLINERIREELRLSKTIRAAVDAGYTRAFSAIFDSNMTVVLTTCLLAVYGTASIKGFAITLMFGVTFSMFTAIIVTRVLFDIMISKFNLRKLSI